MRPEPAAGTFRVPLLLHVDGEGTARLLKEVVVLSGPGGERLLPEPSARMDLLRGSTPESLRTARRFDSAAHDFEGAVLPLAGAFAGGSSLTGRIVMDPDLTTHPFAHRFHPDHDNLDDETGVPLAPGPGAEVPTIERSITLTLDPAAVTTDGAYARIGALYRERISGLAAEPVTIEGPVVLIRASARKELE